MYDMRTRNIKMLLRVKYEAKRETRITAGRKKINMASNLSI